MTSRSRASSRRTTSAQTCPSLVAGIAAARRTSACSSSTTTRRTAPARSPTRLATEHPGRVERDAPHGQSRPRPFVHRRHPTQAIDEPVDVIAQMDADLSHDPAAPARSHRGARRTPTSSSDRGTLPAARSCNWPLRRRLLSRFANIVHPRRDAPQPRATARAAIACWRREALAALPLDRFFSDGYSFLVEMLFVAARTRLSNRGSADHVRRAARGCLESLSSAVLLESAITPWRLIATNGARLHTPPGASR